MTDLCLEGVPARAVGGGGHPQETIASLSRVIDEGNIFGAERSACHAGPTLSTAGDPSIGYHFIRGCIGEIVEEDLGERVSFWFESFCC